MAGKKPSDSKSEEIHEDVSGEASKVKVEPASKKEEPKAMKAEVIIESPKAKEPEVKQIPVKFQKFSN